MRSFSEAVWKADACVVARRSASSRDIGPGIVAACVDGEICGIGATVGDGAGVVEVGGVGSGVWPCKVQTQINVNSTARGNTFGRTFFDILVPWFGRV